MFFNRLHRQEPILFIMGANWLLQMECLREKELQEELQILLKKLTDWFISNDADARDILYVTRLVIRIHIFV